MKTGIALSLMNLFASCPNCKNDKVGNGQGTISIDETAFQRTCKCGYEINLQILEKFPSKSDVSK